MWEEAWEGRGAQGSWLVFKAHFLQGQKRHIPRKRNAGKDTRRLLWINEELLDLHSNMGGRRRNRIAWGDYKGAVKAVKDWARKAKTQATKSSQGHQREQEILVIKVDQQ